MKFIDIIKQLRDASAEFSRNGSGQANCYMVSRDIFEFMKSDNTELFNAMYDAEQQKLLGMDILIYENNHGLISAGRIEPYVASEDNPNKIVVEIDNNGVFSYKINQHDPIQIPNGKCTSFKVYGTSVIEIVNDRSSEVIHS